MRDQEVAVLNAGSAFAQVLIARLNQLPRGGGWDPSSGVLDPVTASEAENFGLVEGQEIPAILKERVGPIISLSLREWAEEGRVSSWEDLRSVINRLHSGTAYSLDIQFLHHTLVALESAVEPDTNPACSRCGAPITQGGIRCRPGTESLILLQRR